ncbi:hypothetical protein C8J56DRAFT_890625 [Mycena floridula]|nr:hypothetical protein C8J56DRAFT_890625 [Mycena floridula]
MAKTKEYKDILLGVELIPTMGAKHAHLRGLEDDTPAMWSALALFHDSGSTSSDLLSAWNKFHTANYTNHSIPLKAHISNIIEIAGRLKSLFSSPPTEEQIIARILSSLPFPKFDDILRVITDHPKIDDRAWVVGRLLKEEMVIRRKGGLGGFITEDGQTHALAATSNSTPVLSPNNRPCCSNCHCKDHELPECSRKVVLGSTTFRTGTSNCGPVVRPKRLLRMGRPRS